MLNRDIRVHNNGAIVLNARTAASAGTGFSVAGISIAKDMAVIEAGFDFDLSDAATLGITYRRQLCAHDHAFNAKLSVQL